MSIKNLVLLMDESSGAEPRLRLGLYMANKYGAHLTGVYLRSPRLLPPQIANLLPNSERRNMEQHLRDTEAAAAQRSGELFNRLCTVTSLGERAHWLVVEGLRDRMAGVIARYSDLVVAGQRTDDEILSPGINPEEVVFESGRPLLVVPQSFELERVQLEHAVLGWNGGREAARALADAMLILETKSLVSVVTVGKRPEVEALHGMTIGEHLQRHGISVHEVILEPRERDPGLDLLRYAEREGAGLLVMGAYSRPRLQEQILGGATRSVLERMTIPVLMSH